MSAASRAIPGAAWPIASARLRDDGHRVSIDSWNPAEIEPAVRAGAELVLSVNRTNRDAAEIGAVKWS